MKVSTVLSSLAAAHAAFAAPAVQKAARAQVSGDAPKIDDPKFISAVMDAHWYWRTAHCAQQLKWDPQLAQAALDSVGACTRKMSHDRGGSNLSGVDPPPDNYGMWIDFARSVVHGWHDEEPKYPWDNPHYEDAWGHFAQVVWRDSSHIGCALAHCNSPQAGRLYCFYERAGNNIAAGEFAKNVYPQICPRPHK
ncbi:PR-1-like protein [Lindgomyces ingoldianus]|uniref:PR-1-like protein n=1 Tax=Lindgomyces ingoldianus TaxID=673940 RepID=A0ACB6QT31_9PLEO|nr:PR-1-like protein [Lindgomyces ingoldianus]KAF2470179.1 PR-1-like protein [Lindgomyces ingoldianus]